MINTRLLQLTVLVLGASAQGLAEWFALVRSRRADGLREGRQQRLSRR